MKNSLIIIALFSSFSCFSQSNECAGAPTLTSNTACTTTSGSTSTGFTSSGVGCTTGNPDDDAWYKFEAVSSTQSIRVDGAANFDAVLACYTSCAATTNASGGTCVDATAGDGVETRNLTGLTVGNTYYIKLHDYAAGGGDFTICLTGTPAPTNDECVSATSITPGNTITGTTAGADQDYSWISQPCTNTGEVWYKFTTPANPACYSFAYDQIVNGCNTISIWEAACPEGAYTDYQANHSTNNYNDQGSNESELGGMLPNTTYYISVSNDIDANFNFTIRPNTPLSTNDVCSGANGIGPTPQIADNAVAGCEYSYVNGQDGGIQATDPNACDRAQDFPCSAATGYGPLALCALTLENISWYQFTAAAAGTITITFSGIECNNGGGGFQSGLFSGSNCSSLTATGACVAAASGTATYTINGASAGSTYFIAMDGNAGSNCHYSVSGLNVVPLPVEIGKFEANLTENNQVKIEWNTYSERNNDYFLVERTQDGVHFEFVGKINGAGNSSQELFYSLLDEDPKTGTTYYRLTQTDFDGKTTQSSFDDVYLAENSKLKVELYPNPASSSESVFLKIKNGNSDLIEVSIYEINGKLINNQTLKSYGNESKFELNHHFNSGIYLIKARNSQGENAIYKWIVE